ncbi:hypothetical protein GWI33_013998 [Rhynchophorus ferrugineus]|uniref:Uncharacterized protein n=1 Tax=Rhynchophorus ferrugineus TaxID=354439 RepID=A0A834I5E1_RHYFE|nr:hypothetical protein GWI33_013998 [Rhynchophorus ferrugineus]
MVKLELSASAPDWILKGYNTSHNENASSDLTLSVAWSFDVGQHDTRWSWKAGEKKTPDHQDRNDGVASSRKKVDRRDLYTASSRRTVNRNKSDFMTYKMPIPGILYGRSLRQEVH